MNRRQFVNMLGRSWQRYAAENSTNAAKIGTLRLPTYEDSELLCQLASLHIPPSQWTQLDEGTKKAIETDAREWVHLFVMDTDDYAQVTWGEYGSLSYWIKRTDLSRHNFEACWATEFSL